MVNSRNTAFMLQSAWNELFHVFDLPRQVTMCCIAAEVAKSGSVFSRKHFFSFFFFLLEPSALAPPQHCQTDLIEMNEKVVFFKAGLNMA